jgi:hypothetical protein
MPSLKTVAAALWAAGVLLTAAALAQGTLAQGTGRWTTGTPMPSARTEIAVAEVGGKIYVVGGFRGERELEISIPLPTVGAAAPPFRARCITRGRSA